MQDTLTNLDKIVLNALQNGFPIAARPFAAIAAELGLAETDFLFQAQALKEAGFVRRFGVFFSPHRLGYQGTLVAIALQKEKIAAVARIVGQYGGVTHNYERDSEYQLWFTLLYQTEEEKEKIIEEICAADGVERFLDLPGEKIYKIRVALPLESEMANNAFSRGGEKSAASSAALIQPKAVEKNIRLDDFDEKLIHRLSFDLPLTVRPFDDIAAELAVPVTKILSRLQEYRAAGLIRRLGLVLAHRRAGFQANGLFAFCVSPEMADDIGQVLADYPSISHCYRRRPDVAKGWPYNLYAMLHGKSRSEVDALTASIAARFSLKDTRLLYSTREWKKTSMIYF